MRCICCIIRCTIDCVSEVCCAEEWESELEADEEDETFFDTLTEMEPSGEEVVVEPDSWVEVGLPFEDVLEDDAE